MCSSCGRQCPLGGPAGRAGAAAPRRYRPNRWPEQLVRPLPSSPCLCGELAPGQQQGWRPACTGLHRPRVLAVLPSIGAEARER